MSALILLYGKKGGADLNYNYRDIIGNLERFHLLRKLFIQRSMINSELHFGQFAVMNYIYDHDGCTQADLAENLKVTPASIATSTKRLQKAEMITKRIDEDNLRCKHLSVTDKGKAEIVQSRRLFDDYDSRLFSDFTDEELSVFNQCLIRLIIKMSEAEGFESENYNDVPISMLIHKVIENSAKKQIDINEEN